MNASDSFALNTDVDLVLTASTTYGMVLLNSYLIDTSIAPIFTTGATDYTLLQDQEYYYLYIPGGTTGTLTVKESLFGRTISKAVTIAETTIDALALAPVTSDAGVSLILEAFTIESGDWNVDAPVGGITSSLAIFTNSGQSLGNTSSEDVALGDLDAIVVNSNNEPNAVWLNDGSGNFILHQSLGR